MTKKEMKREIQAMMALRAELRLTLTHARKLNTRKVVWTYGR